jgi:hypothetical protein
VWSEESRVVLPCENTVHVLGSRSTRRRGRVVELYHDLPERL